MWTLYSEIINLDLMNPSRCAAELYVFSRAIIVLSLAAGLSVAGCNRKAENARETCSRQNPVGTQVAMDAARAELHRRMRVQGIPEAKDPRFYFQPNCCSVETVHHSMFARAIAGDVYATHYVVKLKLRNVPNYPGYVAKYSVNSCGKITEAL